MYLLQIFPLGLWFCSNLSFLYIILFVYLAMLGLHCCVDFSLVVASKGYSLVVVHELIAVASFVVEHRLQSVWALIVAVCRLSNCGSWTLENRLNGCGTWAYLLHGPYGLGLWVLPRPEIESVSPALAEGFFTTEPPGKPNLSFFSFSKGG